jgi:alpha-glucosidase
VGAPTTWVLENHDVPRVRTRYALEAAGAVLPLSNTARMPDVEPDDARGLARARAGLVFMLGLPGSAYLYQGQELALPEVLDLPAEVRQDPAFHRTGGAEGFRDGCRVPMPWTRQAPSFGFSPTGASWLPMPADWGELSVEAQQGDPDSMLELTRRALRLRRAEQALGDGDLHWLSPPDATCLVLRRPADDADPHVLVAMNLGDQPAVVAAESVVLSSGADLAPSPDGTGFVLPPDTAAWLR